MLSRRHPRKLRSSVAQSVTGYQDTVSGLEGLLHHGAHCRRTICALSTHRLGSGRMTGNSSPMRFSTFPEPVAVAGHGWRRMGDNSTVIYFSHLEEGNRVELSGVKDLLLRKPKLHQARGLKSNNPKLSYCPYRHSVLPSNSFPHGYPSSPSGSCSKENKGHRHPAVLRSSGVSCVHFVASAFQRHSASAN
jgi:hypothetical protein